jgi:drug/metabolite transporter (DMT)-like permease
LVLGIVIAVAGLAVVSVAYGNRNRLSGKSSLTQAVPYVAAALCGIVVAVLMFVELRQTWQLTNGTR